MVVIERISFQLPSNLNKSNIGATKDDDGFIPVFHKPELEQLRHALTSSIVKVNVRWTNDDDRHTQKLVNMT